MGQDVSNIGKTGVDSIRIGGMTLDTLPMAEAALTKQQWAKVVEDNTKQEVANIIADFPTTKISYLVSRVNECEDNIIRIKGMRKGQQKMIDEYTTHIGLCDHRDKELAKLEDPACTLTNDDKKSKVRELNLQFPPYNVPAMLQQVVQCNEAIDRADEVIEQEHRSINELRGVIYKCQRRDEVLRSYGVEIG